MNQKSRRRRSVPFVVGVLLAVSVSACSGSGTAKRAALEWAGCGQGAECATLTVPLDAADPKGEQISVALLRYRATGSRIGSLLINPGGPGASGTEFLRSVKRSVVSESVAERYDLVTWDPRGTGRTLPVQCGDRLDYLFDGINYAPRNAAERDALVQASRRFVDACNAGMGGKLSYIGSRDTILDMERIRVALNDSHLDYLGFSYGTYLGAAYAMQHPDRVGRFVLDGAVDPALPPQVSMTQQSIGFDKGLEAFFDSCGKTVTCAFAGSASPAQAFRTLSERVEDAPISASFGKQLGPAQFDIGVASILYSGEAGWRQLATALEEAQRGDGQMLFNAFSSYVDREPGGRYTTQYAAFLAIGCVDSPSFGSVERTFEVAREVGAAAPYFGETGVNAGMPCAMWPVPPTSAPGPVSAPGADPMLVVGTSGDPATPVAWSRSLVKQLGSARLVLSPGEQHTAYGQGNRCVDTTVDAYLVAARVPESTVDCPA